ncbi:MAG: RNA polymerase sigma factor [Candidatus Eisenbacteria bacterium]
MRDLTADRERVRRAREGDEEAWRDIYDTTCDGLFSLLSFQLRDRDEALDLLQETYLRAFRRLGDYRGEAPLEVWLRAIALRMAMDWKRRWLPRRKRALPLEEGRFAAVTEQRSVHFDSERRALRDALGRLSPSQRGALLLREWEGWSFREISTALRCEESTARVHHARARERMRALLSIGTPFAEAEGLEGQRP